MDLERYHLPYTLSHMHSLVALFLFNFSIIPWFPVAILSGRFLGSRLGACSPIEACSVMAVIQLTFIYTFL